MLDEKAVLAAAEALLETQYQELSRKRILAYLVERVGRQWLLADRADVILQKYSGGHELWTASYFCSRCCRIHTRLVSVTDDCTMVVAPVDECK